MSSPRPLFETERLSLRQFCLEDDAFVLELLNEPAFIQYIADKGVRNRADARAYLLSGPLASYEKHGFGLYCVELRNGIPIGMCGLIKRDSLADIDLGYAYLRRHWQQGYAYEAGLAVLNYGHEQLRLRRIIALTAIDN